MSNVSKIRISDLKKSTFFSSFEIKYTEDNKKKKWHFVQFIDNVAVIIFNTTRKKLVFVKQFRPTLYAQNIPRNEWRHIDVKKHPPEIGFSLEFCAGIVDKKMPVEQIAKFEVLEETGYDVPVERLQKVKVLRSTGTAVYDVHLFYVEVDDSMRVGKGTGIEDESINVVELSLTEAESIMNNDSAIHHFAFIFGLMWFFGNKL
ncbi:uridine diphosphate glucose pyrophosphatase NUDT14-like [Planococcus citri]|uniref:uridine diphosphate glucose pyrophosphatase NUDT14-like n=1 Tax=Planococcus citri TaxID=170843 RepID=UPI0031F782B6